jgi:hypothetical protein
MWNSAVEPSDDQRGAGTAPKCVAAHDARIREAPDLDRRTGTKRSPEKADWLRVGRVWLWIGATVGALYLFFAWKR